MPTAYTANAAQDYRPAVVSAEAGCPSMNYGEFTLSAALVQDDTVALCKLPAQHIPIDFILTSTDLDSHGTPTITITAYVENGETDANLIAASTVGQAGGVARMGAAAAAQLAPSDSDRIVMLTFPAGPATGATSGTITGVLLSRPAGRDD